MTGGFTGRDGRGGSQGIRPGFVLGACLLTLGVPFSPRAATAGATGLLADSVAFLDRAAMAQADVSILACSLDRGDTLLSLRASRRLIPASNAKLFTTGAFLRRFGPTYRRSTALLARGKVSYTEKERRVRFKGDLVLRASGMPDVYALLSPGSRGLLDSLAHLLGAGGLIQFEGTLWVDGSLFARDPYGPGWAYDDFAYSYAAPVNAVLANGNTATLIATADGQSVKLALDPPEVPLQIRGEPRIGQTGQAGQTPGLVLRRELGSSILDVSGVLGPGATVRRQVAVPDPDSTAGLLLLGALRRAGIEVKAEARVLGRGNEAGREGPKNPARGLAVRDTIEGVAGSWSQVKSDRATPVVALPSPVASEVVGVVNALSLNAEAEALLRLLDPAPVGKTREGGMAEMMRLVSESGTDTLDLSLVDGSGLSPMNLVAPRAVVTWLTVLHNDSLLGPSFREGLARPGGPGTLKGRFSGGAGGGVLRGKTGTLTNVSALSGFVTTADGERIVFSMLSNGNRGSVAPAREAEEELVALLGRVRRAALPTGPPIGIPR